MSYDEFKKSECGSYTCVISKTILEKSFFIKLKVERKIRMLFYISGISFLIILVTTVDGQQRDGKTPRAPVPHYSSCTCVAQDLFIRPDVSEGLGV